VFIFQTITKFSFLTATQISFPSIDQSILVIAAFVLFFSALTPSFPILKGILTRSLRSKKS